MHAISPNTTYYVQLVGSIESGKNRSGTATGLPYIYRIGGYVYAVP